MSRLRLFPDRSVLMIGLAAVNLALAVTVVQLPRPFDSNQNQYFAQAVRLAGTPLEHDWFVHTPAPFPLFNAAAKAIVAMGPLAVKLSVWPFLFIAFAGVTWLVARLQGGSILRGLLVCDAMVIALRLPHLSVNLFAGFGGQYLFRPPAFLQPNTSGCLLLLAFVPFWRAFTAAGRGRDAGLAFALALAACLFHPTYITAVAVALLGAAIADGAAAGRLPEVARLARLAGGGIALLVPVLAANPQLLQMGEQTPQRMTALTRFAFERIPHHTLLSHWVAGDAGLALMIAAAFVLRWRQGDRWLAAWLASTLGACLIAAGLVQVTRNTSLALLFPWRISVILVPVAAACVAVEAIGLAERALGAVRMRTGTTLALVGATAALAVLSAGQIRSILLVTNTDEATQLVARVQPAGVGLIPLDAAYVRLNAPAAVYVEYKSPPFMSDDLVEWWRRIDAVRRIERDPEAFCTAGLTPRVDWILRRRSAAVPDCLRSWRELGASASYVVIAPPEGGA